MTELLLNEEIYHRVLLGMVPGARKFLWIVTADDSLYLGDFCSDCQRRDYCPDPIA